MSDGYIGDPSLAAPDLVEAVLGVRSFLSAGHFLRSPFQANRWEGPEMRATCKPSRQANRAALLGLAMKTQQASNLAAQLTARAEALPPHRAPHAACHCGVYAYHDLAGLQHHARAVIGVVHAWGLIQLHRAGFRAEYVRVVALALPGDLLKSNAIADRRCVEVARRAAAWWELPLLAGDELNDTSYREFGNPVPKDLLPRAEQKERIA